MTFKTKTIPSRDPRVAAIPVIANPPAGISYSSISKYDECSYLYKLIKVDGALEQADTEPTKTGTYCHKALEEVYEAGSGSPYQVLAGEGGIIDQELEKLGLKEALRDRIQVYSHHHTKLLRRASASYKGEDKIRKANGDVPKMPEATGPWKAYAKEHKLEEMIRVIDQEASKASAKLAAAGKDKDTWVRLRMSKVFGDALGIMHQYTHDPRIAEILQIEFPISEFRYLAADDAGNPLFDENGEPVTTSKVRGPHPLWYEDPKARKGGRLLDILHPFFIPKTKNGKLVKDAEGNYEFRDDAVFVGYIDMLSRGQDGVLQVNDHKTNAGDTPTPAKVARTEQFLLYHFMMWVMTGEWAEIGMNHLRSNRLVLTKVELEDVEAAVARLAEAYRGIEFEVYTRKSAEAYNSPCMKIEDGKDPRFCPGFALCHPKLAKEYSAFYKIA